MCNLGKSITFANAKIMLICGNYLQVGIHCKDYNENNNYEFFIGLIE